MPSFKKLRILKKIFVILFIILLTGFFIPESFKMPVAGAGIKSYDQNSFWFYPWGKSVTHKGVDIFARKGTPVHSSVNGIVVFKGVLSMGGNAVLILGPKWRLHYYAHLDSIKTSRFSFVSTNTVIGTTGNTGNAVGKPAHLHYAISTIIPYPWCADNSVEGWRKMFYLNPVTCLNEYFKK